MNLYQRTLKRSIHCTGIGLHSGKKVEMTIRPAEADTGIVFKRTDLPGSPLIPADVFHVVDTNFCTTIGVEGVTISTVEHLLSALAGMEVDNVLIEVDAPEVPVMDGSSAPFVFLIRGVGFVSQAQPRRFYKVKRKLSFNQNGKRVAIAPSDNLSIDFTIEFDHPVIRRQDYCFDFNPGDYVKHISRARTFGFLRDVRHMQENNLGLGGSLDNAVVMDDFRVLNEDGLRYSDEFVRHKILDFLGDLALVGRPILGSFSAHKSGHELNNAMFRQFLADPQAWQLVTPRPGASVGPKLQAQPSEAAISQPAVA